MPGRFVCGPGNGFGVGVHLAGRAFAQALDRQLPGSILRGSG
ncbi:hypothetical protein C4K40_5346 [Pseudomonas sp. CMR5c]|nr:hypothetical protein C4K40_5346 [Pseudomonas sp. CMR5c]